MNVSNVESTSDIVARLGCEWEHAPYTSDELVFPREAPAPANTQVIFVYFRRFTTNITEQDEATSLDFAYCVRGPENIVKFGFGMTHGTEYCGPLSATPVVLPSKEVMGDSCMVMPIRYMHFELAHKNDETRSRWAYLFDTARLAWSKMIFDPDKLEQFRKKRTDSPREEDTTKSPSDSDSGNDSDSDEFTGVGQPTSAGNASPEAQRIAICQNMEIFKRKFRKQRRSDITKKQHMLIKELAGTAGSLKKLRETERRLRYAGTTAETRILHRQQVRLENERDRITNAILEQLDRPLDHPDDAESIDSSKSEDDALLSQEQLDAVTDFVVATGAEFEIAQQSLKANAWRQELAISQYNRSQDAAAASEGDGYDRAEIDAATRAIRQ
ncbi:hypothetical protein EJ02DRAFT_433237 [Clathrospora elynae]|uniref:Uncharacterized protein n=1 Tax=Clathrospora elynae TaxID=706981 RepID=A0A6A5SUW0_9PLEO|nr:hypothetical protein EJ02DRAFT_433237 [Clathrospora elynae]